MGHGKETPRQKMIGMMYLFLTALLAMNVSKDILDSFILIEKGIGKTVSNFTKKNELYYNLFNKAFMENPVKAKEWNDKALSVKQQADETVKFLHDIRREIVKIAGGAEKEPGTIKADGIVLKDNTDHVPRIMLNDGKGEELRKKINDYRSFLVKLIDKPEKNKEFIESFSKTLDTEDPPVEGGELKTWVTERFQHLPLISSVCFMTIIEGDIRNAEADILSYLYSKIDAADMKFNKIDAIVKQNSNYIMSGAKFEAQIFLAAYDSTQKPTVYVNAEYDAAKNEVIGKDTLKIENGKGIIEEVANGAGERKKKGVIRIKGPEGFKYYPWETSYTAAQGGIVISPTKMNVFYRGIANPIKISAVGYTDEQVTANSTNQVSFKKIGVGSYEIIPGEGLESIVSVMTKGEGGASKNAGTENFRVKNIPKPFASINGQSDGKIAKNQLTAAPGIAAELKDFPFDLKFNVTGYTFIQTVGGLSKELNVTGAMFTPEIQKILKNVGSGSTVTFYQIKAKGPDGKSVQLSPIVFTIK